MSPGTSDTRVTIHDVAERAHVSRQTVSNVVNAPERVRAATRERVQAAIDELGYHPSRSARNLRSRATRLLGYHVSPATQGAINIVLDRFLHALAEAARDHGYQVLLFTSPGGAPELEAYDELLRTNAVDGFVLSETNYDDPRISHLLARGVPLAVFGRSGLSIDYPWVDVDNALGTRLATEHLLAAGHRRIAFVGWPEGSVTGDERARGYRETLAAAGRSADPQLDSRGPDTVESGRLAAERWLGSEQPPDGVVAASDLLAIGVLEAARAHGVRVGSELGVTGFDDTPTAALLDPPLTSVRQPIEEVAGRIVTHVVERIDGAPSSPHGELLEPYLIVRDS